VALAALWLWAATAHAAAPSGDVVIVLEPSADLEDVDEELRRRGGRIVSSIPQLRAYLVDLPGQGASASVLARLREYPGVRDAGALSAVATAEVRLDLALNDPSIGSAWHIGKINAPLAWNTTIGSTAVKIAIIDTGVDYTHPDLAGKVTLGPDYGSGDSDPRDTHGHGTHVAGIAAAIGNNGIGSAGVCPACHIVAIKVFPDGSGSTYDWPIAQGITWAADNGVKVINLSLGGTGASTVTQNAVNYAWSKGVVVIAAAGNSATSTPHYPAAFTNAIAVGSTTSSDTLSSFSNYGSWVDVTAPGSGIYSTIRGGGYASWSGTSMATPVVAGAAGLAFSALAGATASSVRAALEAGVVDLGVAGRDTTFGFGRIDASKLFTGAPAPAPLAIATTSLPAATVGTAYSRALSATGGVSPYTWSITAGTLPSGIVLAPSTGTLSGTPTAAASAALTFRVADGSGSSTTRSLTLTVNAAAPAPLAIATSTLPAGTAGTAYSTALSATGGTSPYTWSITAGTLPSGITLSPSAGTLSGTPMAAASATLTFRVADSAGGSITRSLTLTMNAAPPAAGTLTVATTSLPTAYTRAKYAATLAATGGTGAYTWAITGGALPSGLALNTATGAISGLAKGLGTFTITVRVTDATGATASRSLTLTVKP
jgi:thermitase